MIEIEKARNELIDHVRELELDNPRIDKKINHMIRVAQNAKKIAIALELPESNIQLAELIGLLHDIGRFEQYKIFNKNTENKVLDDTQKFDHGKAGVEVLKKDGYIRRYIEESTYDDIIFTAIYEHNKYELTKGLTKEQALYSKIVKDSDKLDLFYEANYIYWQDAERIKQVEEGTLSSKMLEDFYNGRLADNRNRVSQTDQILRFASFIYDLHFQYSFQILQKNQQVSKMIERFNYQLPKTKEEMKKVKKIANEFIRRKET